MLVLHISIALGNTLHWIQIGDSYLGRSQMANSGLLRPVVSPGLISQPRSTH